MEVLPQVKSASVVPYTINAKNEILFLLGLEGYAHGWRESGKWGVFGGKIEKSDLCAEYGAARECYEETAGCLMSHGELRQKLKQGDFALALDAIFKKTRSVYYFVQVPYADYPAFFRNTKQFVQYCGGKVDCIEKTQLKWVSINQLRRELAPPPPPPPPSSRHGFANFNQRRPVFRRKFIEVMRFFYDHNGFQYLYTGNSHAVSKYIYFHVDMGASGGASGGASDETSACENAQESRAREKCYLLRHENK